MLELRTESMLMVTSIPRAMIVLFLTASLALVSCGNKACWMDWWYDTKRPENIRFTCMWCTVQLPIKKKCKCQTKLDLILPNLSKISGKLQYQHLRLTQKWNVLAYYMYTVICTCRHFAHWPYFYPITKVPMQVTY